MIMSQNKVLIIGNSAAALSAIRAIRKKNKSIRITLISRERCRAYSPVLITYYLHDQIDEASLFIVDSSFYRDSGVKCILGKEVTEVQPAKQEVDLNDGQRLSYDYLLIASGASPKTLEHVSADAARGLCYLRTSEDARRIKEMSNRATEATIIGGGLVSMQTASALSRKGIRLTFVIGANQVLVRNVDEECATLVKEHIQATCGANFLFGRAVRAIDFRKGRYHTLLDNGEEVAADLVFVGRGVEPNINLVANSGIHVNKGILIDDHGETNIAGIYAAGDVTESRNLVTGKIENIANWINACEQGRIAGANISGARESYRGGVNENITQLFGLPIASIGMTKLEKTIAEPNVIEAKYVDPKRKVYRKALISKNKLIGALLMGEIMDIGIIRNLIVNGGNISVLEEDFPRVPLRYTKRVLTDYSAFESEKNKC